MRSTENEPRSFPHLLPLCLLPALPPATLLTQPAAIVSAAEKKAKAVFAYNAEKPTHLTVALDEVVTVLDDKKRWWVVRNAQGKQGKVPSNYMELVSDSAAAAAASAPSMDAEPWFHADIVDRTLAERRLSAYVLRSRTLVFFFFFGGGEERGGVE